MILKSKINLPELPVDPGHTTQQNVYARLRHAIMVGAIAPGTTLTIRGLAEALNLSPTPIREAVRRLSSENAIEVLGNRRMTVPLMNPGRFEELVALRVAVEIHAAARSLPYISDIIARNLEELDQKMDSAVAYGALDDLTLLNQEFHRILYTTNPNQTSLAVVESIWLQLGPFHRQVTERVSGYYQVDHHKKILAALVARDATALAAAIENDIRDGIVSSGRDLLAQQASITEVC